MNRSLIFVALALLFWGFGEGMFFNFVPIYLDNQFALSKSEIGLVLPNVLLEAQSQGLPCVATRVSAIPELVRDAHTGLLVEENDPDALARALEALISSPARRRALGVAGQARVVETFGLDANLEPLARKFGLGESADATAAGANRLLRSA